MPLLLPLLLLLPVVTMDRSKGWSAPRRARSWIARREAHGIRSLERLDGEKERPDDEMRSSDESCARTKERPGNTRQIGNGPDRAGAGGAGGNEGQDAIKNYFDKFEWSEKMEKQMKSVFLGIESFRLAQEGASPPSLLRPLARVLVLCSWGFLHRVCNANMDGRDIMNMPTGQSIRHSSILPDDYMRSFLLDTGGKSLTYQLPATPCPTYRQSSVSLMKDQALYCRRKTVSALLLSRSRWSIAEDAQSST